MSRVLAALQRAFAHGGAAQATVIDLRPDIVHKPDFNPESPARRVPTDRDRPNGSSPLPEPDTAAELPPEVASQLANVAQLLHSHPAKLRTIAFVAAGRGEGTTTCLAHLAVYLARQQSSVLMIDANLPAPALHTLADVNAGPGLIDVMTGDVPIKSAIQQTGIHDLDVLTAGEWHPAGANRLLLPSAVRDRTLTPTTDYDFVLVDCPALSVYGHAAVTAATCDAALLVVEGGRTLREQAQSAKTLLTRAQCTILGVVMNKRKFHIPKFIYDRL
jgi:protein-tyrosine kinase